MTAKMRKEEGSLVFFPLFLKKTSFVFPYFFAKKIASLTRPEKINRNIFFSLSLQDTSQKKRSPCCVCVVRNTCKKWIFFPERSALKKQVAISVTSRFPKTVWKLFLPPMKRSGHGTQRVVVLVAILLLCWDKSLSSHKWTFLVRAHQKFFLGGSNLPIVLLPFETLSFNRVCSCFSFAPCEDNRRTFSWPHLHPRYWTQKQPRRKLTISFFFWQWSLWNFFPLSRGF